MSAPVRPVNVCMSVWCGGKSDNFDSDGLPGEARGGGGGGGGGGMYIDVHVYRVHVQYNTI